MSQIGAQTVSGRGTFRSSWGGCSGGKGMTANHNRNGSCRGGETEGARRVTQNDDVERSSRGSSHSRRLRRPCFHDGQVTMTGTPYHLPQPDREAFPRWLLLWFWCTTSAVFQAGVLAMAWVTRCVDRCSRPHSDTAPLQHPAARKLLLLTSPRSGSTMLGDLLNQHPCCA